jgi:hypothetical protein
MYSNFVVLFAEIADLIGTCGLVNLIFRRKLRAIMFNGCEQSKNTRRIENSIPKVLETLSQKTPEPYQ